MKTLLQNREEALAAHELARSRMTNRRKSTFTPLKKDDRVWLDSRNLKTIYHKKMKPKREGPFRITEDLGPLTYRLQLPTSWRIHNVFHATLLKPYKENETYGQNFPEPPPELVEVGIVMGNPGVFSGNPHPYPPKPVPTATGAGFDGYGNGFHETCGSQTHSGSWYT